MSTASTDIKLISSGEMCPKLTSLTREECSFYAKDIAMRYVEVNEKKSPSACSFDPASGLILFNEMDGANCHKDRVCVCAKQPDEGMHNERIH